MSEPLYNKLNSEQRVAVEAIFGFLEDPSKLFFLLEGYAGTGKTFSLQAVLERMKSRMIFTAPTNKATKVLRETLASDNYKPECRTIYSLLGLRIEANGEVKELAIPDDPVDLSAYKCVVVDEGSMINSSLMKAIREAAQIYKVKFLFMGDPAQLPPVGEPRSGIWSIKDKACLTNVERHDNQILGFVTSIRQVVDNPLPKIKIKSDYDPELGEGVLVLPGQDFESRIVDHALRGRFSVANTAKAISWRNVNVDKLNKLIRSHIFSNPVDPWLPDDRVIVMEPAKDHDDQIVATTDEEGRVVRAVADYHPKHGEFKIWHVSMATDEGKTIGLNVLHQDALGLYNRRVEELLSQAKSNGRYWKDFWAFKEAFHKLRHGYAITAHRSQGSTYEEVFVDWRDILINRNKAEAYRCLYVACSRPKKQLFLN